MQRDGARVGVVGAPVVDEHDLPVGRQRVEHSAQPVGERLEVVRLVPERDDDREHRIGRWHATAERTPRARRPNPCQAELLLGAGCAAPATTSAAAIASSSASARASGLPTSSSSM